MKPHIFKMKNSSESPYPPWVCLLKGEGSAVCGRGLSPLDAFRDLCEILENDIHNIVNDYDDIGMLWYQEYVLCRARGMYNA